MNTNEIEPTLLSASEARKILNSGQNLVDQESYHIAVLGINAAIKSGKDVVQVNNLTPNTRARLEAAGYRVEVGSQYNETYYNIVIP